MQEIATKIVKTLQEAGHIAYFAGGFVRDLIMKHESDDIDIATDATVKEIEKLFNKTIPVGVAFGIVIVALEGEQFEVASFRKDRGYVDGRRPTGIDPATPEEDATRRDFTINGMFYDPITEKLYDFVGGQEDIEKKVIRAIGNPDERFFEDRLRMMRAVRYSTRFGFPIEEQTLNAIQAHAKDLIPAVAMERVWQEFKKMSTFAHFDTGLILLHELGLLPTIFPELKEVTLAEIKKRVQYIEKFPKGSPTFAELLELFPDYDLDAVFTLSEYLKLSNKEKAFAKFYHHATALFNMPLEWREKLEKMEWAEFYADPFSDIGLKMIAVKQKEPAAFLEKEQKRKASLQVYIERIQNKTPYLKAEHLIQAGVKPGVKMGELLHEGMRIAVNEDITDPKELLTLLKESTVW
ncbi:MAG: CCA tRNA nucleotidyltransferase [Simkaniaceae bacterium]|nr:CCA tRNA nucleotidyltransferase [Candidatus Sacchlamyda saccharinae]